MIDMNSARIVVTIPPERWFGGADRRIAHTVRRQLEQRFGSTFYQLDTTPFVVKGEEAGQQDSLANLKAYNPQLAISLNNAGYGLACVVKDGESSLNLFTDILNIPMMLLWDHGLFQFPAITLSPLAKEVAESTGDALRRVREKINHPLMYHYPIDSGQVGEMRRIGLLQSHNVAAMPSLAYQPFIEYGRKHAERHYINDV